MSKTTKKPYGANEFEILRVSPADGGVHVDIYARFPPEVETSLVQSVGSQVEQLLSDHQIDVTSGWFLSVLWDSQTIAVELEQTFEHALDTVNPDAKRVLCSQVTEQVMVAIGGIEELAEFRFHNLSPDSPKQ